jgi:acyl-CoA oxidase
MQFILHYNTLRIVSLLKRESEMQEIEALAAGMKAYSTWSTTAVLGMSRSYWRQGYLSENRIDALKNDTEIYTTFEGDNTVLMQLVAKNRLSIPEIIWQNGCHGNNQLCI